MRKALMIISVGILLSAVSAISDARGAVESPVHWVAKPSAATIGPGDSVEAQVEASIDAPWHLYSATTPPGGPNPTRFSLISGEPFELTGPVRQQSSPIVRFDEGFGINTEFFSGAATFGIPLKAAPDAKPGKYEVRLQVIYQVCDDRRCLPPTKVPIPFEITISAGGSQVAGASKSSTKNQPLAEKPRNVSQELPAPLPLKQSTTSPDAGTALPAISSETQAVTKSPEPTQPTSDTSNEVQQARAAGFLPFLWLSMTMGLISLATPCVFPMIPITVSFFIRNSEGGRGSGVIHALIYCFGIIFTFTGLGLGLAAILGATGINKFAANPWVNLLISAIFVGFALSLLGLFEIGIPSSVLTKLSNASSGKGYWPTLLMGLTFTLTSFTCTVPFVGTVLVATAQGDWFWPAVGMLGYSVSFAAPFFILALLPKMLKRLPKSGGWLNSVKVTMGLVIIAFAMKYVSNADHVWNWNIFTRNVVLAIWLSIAVLTTFYLLGKFRLPYDTPVESLGVIRLLFALVFLATGFYLLTGLMGASLGELDAFLPPRTAGASTLTGTNNQELSWKSDMNSGLEEARQQQRPLFVDFTGYTCTNCRWMKANIFPLPAIHSELGKFVRVQLYTDGTGKQYEDNQNFQQERFGTVALPFYAILDPQGKTLATFPGMTRKPEEFLRFLRTPF
jgi:thiol:disulfide interchange protein